MKRIALAALAAIFTATAYAQQPLPSPRPTDYPNKGNPPPTNDSNPLDGRKYPNNSTAPRAVSTPPITRGTPPPTPSPTPH